MEKRTVLMAAVISGVTILASYGTYNYYQHETEKTVVTLMMDYHMLKDPDVHKNIEMPEGSTVLDLLEKKTNVIVEETEYGKMVISINDIPQDRGKNLWWTYTINGEYASLGADAQLLNDGDVIQWTLTKF